MNKILTYILLAPILGFFLININPNLVYSKNNSPSFKKVSCKINYKNNLSQKVILEALRDDSLDIMKKANIALRFIGFMKGKDDLSDKSNKRLFKRKRIRPPNSSRS